LGRSEVYGSARAPRSPVRPAEDPEACVHVARVDQPGRFVDDDSPDLGRVGEDGTLRRLDRIVAGGRVEIRDLDRVGWVARVDDPDAVRVPDEAENPQLSALLSMRAPESSSVRLSGDRWLDALVLEATGRGLPKDGRYSGARVLSGGRTAMGVVTH
jgi:hypothetical protein